MDRGTSPRSCPSRRLPLIWALHSQLGGLHCAGPVPSTAERHSNSPRPLGTRYEVVPRRTGTHPSTNLSSMKVLRSAGPPGRPSGPHQHPRHLTRCLRTLQSVFTYALHFAQTASSRLPTTSSIAATPRGRPRLSIYPTTQAANSKRRQPRWPFLLGLAPLPT